MTLEQTGFLCITFALLSVHKVCDLESYLPLQLNLRSVQVLLYDYHVGQGACVYRIEMTPDQISLTSRKKRCLIPSVIRLVDKTQRCGASRCPWFMVVTTCMDGEAECLNCRAARAADELSRVRKTVAHPLDPRPQASSTVAGPASLRAKRVGGGAKLLHLEYLEFSKGLARLGVAKCKSPRPARGH